MVRMLAIVTEVAGFYYCNKVSILLMFIFYQYICHLCQFFKKIYQLECRAVASIANLLQNIQGKLFCQYVCVMIGTLFSCAFFECACMHSSILCKFQKRISSLEKNSLIIFHLDIFHVVHTQLSIRGTFSFSRKVEYMYIITY